MTTRLDIRFKKLDERAISPVFSTACAAGADLHALPGEREEIAPGETRAIRTGLAVEIPDGYAGLVFARSGLASREGLAPANKVGLIDSDYRGEVIVMLHNHSQTPAVVEGGERVAQLMITPVPAVTYIEAAELSDTERGSGGFGSTGKNRRTTP